MFLEMCINPIHKEGQAKRQYNADTRLGVVPKRTPLHPWTAIGILSFLVVNCNGLLELLENLCLNCQVFEGSYLAQGYYCVAAVSLEPTIIRS